MNRKNLMIVLAAVAGLSLVMLLFFTLQNKNTFKPGNYTLYQASIDGHTINEKLLSDLGKEIYQNNDTRELIKLVNTSLKTEYTDEDSLDNTYYKIINASHAYMQKIIIIETGNLWTDYTYFANSPATIIYKYEVVSGGIVQLSSTITGTPITSESDTYRISGSQIIHTITDLVTEESITYYYKRKT